MLNKRTFKSKGGDVSNIFSKLVMPEVKYAIQNTDEESLNLIIDEFFPQDIAELMEELSEEERSFLFEILPKEKALEVFSELDYPEQEDIIESLDDKKIEDILNEMAPDDRTELFEDMPDKMAERYIDSLSKEEKDIAQKYMAYPEDSVARLSTPDFIELKEFFTVKEAIEHIRNNHHEKETIFYSYITDNEDKLVGVVSLKDLVISPDDTKITEIIENNIIKIEADKDQEEAANLMKKYDLLALPVVGVNNKIIGIVTFDDLVDIVEEEATEDIHKMAGMLPTEDSYLDNSFKEVFKNRVFWLIVLLIMQTITGMVLKGFSNVLDQVVALSFYIPLLIGTGGNAGTQSSTLVIRGMATGDIENKDIWQLLKREMSLALSMGIVLAILTFVRVYFQEGDNALAMVVSLGLLATITASMLSGTLLPMFFRLLKLDPALMSGPFISTSIDIIGLVIYLQIARLIMHI